MPQVANQDYNVIRIESLSSLSFRELSRLAGAIEREVFFDMIISTPSEFPGPVGESLLRPIVLTKADNGFVIELFYSNLQSATITTEYSSVQYNALADIQDNGADARVLSVSEDGYLCDENGVFVCVDNLYITVTIDDDDKISSYVVTDVEAVGVDVANIPEEDLPGLIGLFAGN